MGISWPWIVWAGRSTPNRPAACSPRHCLRPTPPASHRHPPAASPACRPITHLSCQNKLEHLGGGEWGADPQTEEEFGHDTLPVCARLGSLGLGSLGSRPPDPPGFCFLGGLMAPWQSTPQLSMGGWADMRCALAPSKNRGSWGVGAHQWPARYANPRCDIHDMQPRACPPEWCRSCRATAR